MRVEVGHKCSRFREEGDRRTAVVSRHRRDERGLGDDGNRLVTRTTRMRKRDAGTDRTIRFSVRFRQPNLNIAAARQLVSCRWTFTDSYIPQMPGIKRAFAKLRQWLSMDDGSSRIVQNILLPEDGWYVHHYFEKYVVASTISVNFYDSRAEPINLGPADNWPTSVVKPQQSRRGKKTGSVLGSN
jgi:hypothetical protein